MAVKTEKHGPNRRKAEGAFSIGQFNQAKRLFGNDAPS
jgi:hypothetical protein